MGVKEIRVVEPDKMPAKDKRAYDSVVYIEVGMLKNYRATFFHLYRELDLLRIDQYFKSPEKDNMTRYKYEVLATFHEVSMIATWTLRKPAEFAPYMRYLEKVDSGWLSFIMNLTLNKDKLDHRAFLRRVADYLLTDTVFAPVVRLWGEKVSELLDAMVDMDKQYDSPSVSFLNGDFEKRSKERKIIEDAIGSGRYDKEEKTMSVRVDGREQEVSFSLYWIDDLETWHGEMEVNSVYAPFADKNAGGQYIVNAIRHELFETMRYQQKALELWNAFAGTKIKSWQDLSDGDRRDAQENYHRWQLIHPQEARQLEQQYHNEAQKHYSVEPVAENAQEEPVTDPAVGPVAEKVLELSPGHSISVICAMRNIFIINLNHLDTYGRADSILVYFAKII